MKFPVTPILRKPQVLQLVAAICLWWTGNSAAAPAAPVIPPLDTEEDIIGDIDTVISATRIRQPRTESPSSVTVIDRDMIETSGAVEIADVLRLVPGIQVAYPQGNQMAVAYHGFADAFPRSMQVLVDGRSIYQPSFADVDWVMLGITLEDIERIEVIRGPDSPLYGANAVAGVINIITRLPLQDRGTTARITGGSLQTRFGMLSHSETIGKLDYRVTLNYQENAGVKGDLNSTNDGRKLGGASLRGLWHPRASDEVDLQFGISDGKLGGGAEPQFEPTPHNKQVSSDYEFISWRRAMEDAADLRVQFYHNGYDSSDHYRDLLSHAWDIPPAAIPVVIPGQADQPAGFGLFDYRGERYDLELQYTSPQTGRLRTVAGAGLRLNRLDSNRLTDQNNWISESSQRAFLNSSYRATSHLLLNLGAMAEHSSEFGSYLSPRVNVSWLFNDRHSVRLSYARARRNPSLLEEHFDNVYRLDDGTAYLTDFRSNNPGPETLTSVELGYIGYWLDRRLMLDAKLFREQTTDRIRFVEDPTIAQPLPTIPFPVSTLINDGYTRVDGGEMQLKYQTAPRDFITLQASVLDTDALWRRQVNPDILSIYPENIAPRYTASLLLSKSLANGFEVSSAVYHLGDMVWLGDGDRLKAYTRVDARLARRWQSAGSHMMLEAIVQNIGKDYPSFRYENIFDTRAYLRFTIGLN
jgi:iron complex outermembrane recepter protein